MAELLKPKLRYLFCMANYRSLWPQLSLIRYLNAVGVESYVAVQDVGMTPQSRAALAAVRIKTPVMPSALPTDYDVMLSQSVGLDAFEKKYLELSWAMGKTNIKVHNSISTYNRLVNINYTADRVHGHVHGMAMKDQRSINHFRRFLKESDCWMLNVGDPDWDYLKTEEYAKALEKYWDQYGPRVLLILASFDAGNSETQFWTTVIPWAEERGFIVQIRTHPGCEHRLPKELEKYRAPDLHRFVLFAGASHAIGEIASSTIAECHRLGTRVGTYPFVPHTPKYGVHTWIDHPTVWRETVAKQVGAELLSYVPYVHTHGTMDNFLSETTPFIGTEQMNHLWGWPTVPNYCEHFFMEVERKLGC